MKVKDRPSYARFHCQGLGSASPGLMGAMQHAPLADPARDHRRAAPAWHAGRKKCERPANIADEAAQQVPLLHETEERVCYTAT
jgi:hypothetical protein